MSISGRKEGGADEMQIIPASVKKLVEMEEREQEVEKKSESGVGKESCRACGAEKEAEKLSRCKGCELFWYCDKVS